MSGYKATSTLRPSGYSQAQPDAVARELNERPRGTLGDM